MSPLFDPLFSVLLLAQLAMGAFDVLFHHELVERLSWRRACRRELRLHAARNLLYAVIFLGLGGLAWQGAFAWIFLALLLVEVVITLADFLEEDRSRVLLPSERVLHTLLALNYGALLALFAAEWSTWAAAPSGFQWFDRGFWSWFLPLAAIGVLLFGLRDWQRARVLQKEQRLDPAELVAGLPARRRILVTGGTGLLGRRLIEALLAAGHSVILLTRDHRKLVRMPGPLTVVTDFAEIDAREEIHAVVNLAGAGIADLPWTPARRRLLRQSRLRTLAGLSHLMKRLEHPVGVFVQASAMGIYRPDPALLLDEEAPFADSFSGRLCRDVEAAAAVAAGSARLVCLRFGLILSGEGGFLGRIMTAFEYGLAVRLGPAGRWVSWIHRDDAVGLVAQALGDARLVGACNAVSPQALESGAMTRHLAKALKAPLPLVLPAVLVEGMLGDFGREIFLASHRVVPRKATRLGFAFRYPSFEAAVAEIVQGQQGALPLKSLGRRRRTRSDHALLP